MSSLLQPKSSWTIGWDFAYGHFCVVRKYAADFGFPTFITERTRGICHRRFEEDIFQIDLENFLREMSEWKGIWFAS